MPLDPNFFREDTKKTLAKRAGNRRSNPSCRQSTSGPHVDDDKFINIGEAAHIRGARPGSARYDASMTPEERRAITNGIWLCKTCARLIDRDDKRYSVDILCHWKSQNEDEALSEIEGGRKESDRRIMINSSEKRTLRNRRIILNRVHDFWIKGVLEKSLHNEVLIHLNKEACPEFINHPWDMQVQEATNLSPYTISKEKSIFEIFHEVGPSLLILGGPGSGKTITLLELAQDVIREALGNFALPIPLVFNLSSWTKRKQTFRKWLVDEFKAKYQIPPKVSKDWIERNELLLLLDGLDEVAVEAREHCVTAINQFRQEYGLIDVVVCSRIEEYKSLSTNLNLSGAILLQALTKEQIDTYLVNTELDLTALRMVLTRNSSLQELVRSPLMLNVMVLAYQGIPAEDIDSFETRDESQRRLFFVYINRMLKRRSIEKKYTPEQTISRLSWLAKQMAKTQQTEFFIENVQSSWLCSRTQRWFYNVSVELLIAFVFTFLFIVLSNDMFQVIAFLTQQPLDMPISPIILTSFFLGIPYFLYLLISFRLVAVTTTIKKLSEGAALGVAIATTTIFSFALSIFLGMLGILIFLIGGIIIGSSAGLISFSVLQKHTIKVSDAIGWSWTKAKRGLFKGLIFIGPLVGFMFGISAMVIFNIREDDVNNIVFEDWTFVGIVGLISAVVGSLLFGILFMLISGPIRDVVVEARITPNQGINFSARHALEMGLLFALGSFFIIIFPSSFLPISQGIAMVLGTFVSLPIGLAVGLFAGGSACIQHYLLRFIFIVKGYFPWRLSNFLDYAVKCVFLRKVGGGYIFIHRLLMEYFASLSKEESY